jgi:hypothetical protein
MSLHELYRNGVITFEQYTQKLMAKFDASIKKAENYLKEMEVEECMK